MVTPSYCVYLNHTCLLCLPKWHLSIRYTWITRVYWVYMYRYLNHTCLLCVPESHMFIVCTWITHVYHVYLNHTLTIRNYRYLPLCYLWHHRLKQTSDLNKRVVSSSHLCNLSGYCFNKIFILDHMDDFWFLSITLVPILAIVIVLAQRP